MLKSWSRKKKLIALNLLSHKRAEEKDKPRIILSWIFHQMPFQQFLDSVQEDITLSAHTAHSSHTAQSEEEHLGFLLFRSVKV